MSGRNANVMPSSEELSRRSSGAPVNDGSPAFKEQVLSRIEKADRRIGVISSEEFFRRWDEKLAKKYAKEVA